MEWDDDAAILAAIASQPEGIALLFRRHAPGLLDALGRRTRDPERAAELCAEAFAVALERPERYDPARGPVADWLGAIAMRLLEQAERRGVVVGHAQRRLGMAPLRLVGAASGGALSASAPGRRFLRELEEELLAAARFRATRRTRRALVPRRLQAIVLAGVAVLLLLALLVGKRGVEEPRATPAPAGSLVLLRSMQRDTYCGGAAPGSEPWAREPIGLGVLQRPQRKDDVLPAAALERLPLTGVDPALTRRGGSRGALTTVHIVPARAVPGEAPCGRVALPGICLVETGLRYRCFSVWEVGSGRALARSPLGLIVGVVPDGITAVQLSARGRTVGADVVDNVYEAQLDVPAGTHVRFVVSRRSSTGDGGPGGAVTKSSQ
jgi:DNA-directed RNA polymerase specialized sigma24 family protein